MALFKTNHHVLGRERGTVEKNNDLTVTGVKVLIDLWCSKVIEEQILRRLNEILGDEDEKISEDEICQRIEQMFKDEFSSVKTSISREQKKETSEVMCPFSIHITIEDENEYPKIEMKPTNNLQKNATMEVLTISVRRKLFK